jgi:hypothetical protein
VGRAADDALDFHARAIGGGLALEDLANAALVHGNLSRC